MAHRLLVRRILRLTTKDIICLPASSTTTASYCFSTTLQSPTTRVAFLSASRTLPRSLPHTSRREVSFNVQDHEDFTERVINSQLPVLIDFHAQWVLWVRVIANDLQVFSRRSHFNQLILSVGRVFRLGQEWQSTFTMPLKYTVDPSGWSVLLLFKQLLIQYQLGSSYTLQTCCRWRKPETRHYAGGPQGPSDGTVTQSCSHCAYQPQCLMVEIRTNRPSIWRVYILWPGCVAPLDECTIGFCVKGL